MEEYNQLKKALQENNYLETITESNLIWELESALLPILSKNNSNFSNPAINRGALICTNSSFSEVDFGGFI